MSEELQNLLNKYECKLVDSNIINKNGNDTKINLQSFVELQENVKSIGASNEKEVMTVLLNVLEESLKERSVI